MVRARRINAFPIFGKLASQLTTYLSSLCTVKWRRNTKSSASCLGYANDSRNSLSVNARSIWKATVKNIRRATWNLPDCQSMRLEMLSKNCAPKASQPSMAPRRRPQWFAQASREHLLLFVLFILLYSSFFCNPNYVAIQFGSNHYWFTHKLHSHVHRCRCCLE